MTSGARFSKLHERHAELESKIKNETNRPNPDQMMLSDLKLKKLRIKEEIERLKV